jgi:hypothetical protein
MASVIQDEMLPARTVAIKEIRETITVQVGDRALEGERLGGRRHGGRWFRRCKSRSSKAQKDFRPRGRPQDKIEIAIVVKVRDLGFRGDKTPEHGARLASAIHELVFSQVDKEKWCSVVTEKYQVVIPAVGECAKNHAAHPATGGVEASRSGYNRKSPVAIVAIKMAM